MDLQPIEARPQAIKACIKIATQRVEIRVPLLQLRLAALSLGPSYLPGPTPRPLSRLLPRRRWSTPEQPGSL